MPIINLFPLFLCLIVSTVVLTWLGGGYSVLRRKATRAQPDTQLLPAILASIFALICWPVGMLLPPLYALFRATQMLTWSIQAARRDTAPPEHLKDVHPRQMAISGVLLFFMPPAMICAQILGYVPTLSPNYPSEAQRTRADLHAYNDILKDIASVARVKDLHELFADPASLNRPTLEETIRLHTRLCNTLILKGRDADCDLKPEVRKRLRPVTAERLRKNYRRPRRARRLFAGLYLIGMGRWGEDSEPLRDSWGNPYQFFIGPWTADERWGCDAIPFLVSAPLNGMYGDNYVRTGSEQKHAYDKQIVYIASNGPNGHTEQIRFPNQAQPAGDEPIRSDDYVNWQPY